MKKNRNDVEPIEIVKSGTIYYVSPWIEDNPVCPIHKRALAQTPCKIVDEDKSISFDGYYCSDCRKIIVRKTQALDIADEFEDAGFGELSIEQLEETSGVNSPKKKRTEKIEPDYFIEDGRIEEYRYSAKYAALSEEDTIVVANERYCPEEDHKTDEDVYLISVRQRKGGIKQYLVILGYCEDCNKYYICEDDYKCIYNIGRPLVNVITKDEETYHISSGEVYNLEKGHLDRTENAIKNEIASIKSSSNYVSKYAVGDYDDGQLSYAKERSERVYGKKLEDLNSYIDVPYSHRVDIIGNDGDTETYYLGPSDIDIGNTHVVSYNGEFGRKLVNYQTTKIKKNRKDYEIRLHRQCDVSNAYLFSYLDLRTDEDRIFRKGVTDPFLLRVLKARRQQHNLTDIIATIQENQNRIVDQEIEKNIIVQGCAGSGKTMVLLHRLSSLKYRYPEFDFSTALILTPNDNFNLHINDLAEGLQLQSIKRVSIENYYKEVLAESSDLMRFSGKLVPEEGENQEFVDFIYSDDFLERFHEGVEKQQELRNQLEAGLNEVLLKMGKSPINLKEVPIEKLSKEVNEIIDGIRLDIRSRHAAVEEAEKAENDIRNRKNFLEKQITESSKTFEDTLAECIVQVNTRLVNKIGEYKDALKENEQTLIGLDDEIVKIEEALLPFRKRSKIKTIEQKKEKIQGKNTELEKEIQRLSAYLKEEDPNESNDDKISWMRLVKQLNIPADSELHLCGRLAGNLENYQSELSAIGGKLEKAAEAIKNSKDNLYPAEIAKDAEHFDKAGSEWELLGIYRKSFLWAVSDKLKELEITMPKGEHRYNLYSKLWFLLLINNKGKNACSYMTIDEGQDIALNEYKLIDALNNHGTIYNVYGDTNQLIKTGRGIGDWSVLKGFLNAEIFTLNENYRNTNEITKFCNDSFSMSVKQTGISGKKVREISKHEIEEDICKCKYNDQRVAILIPHSMEKDKVIDREILPAFISRDIGNEIGIGKIALMYVDEVKGIEFDRVYVYPETMQRNEKYIAYTRALSELIIVV